MTEKQAIEAREKFEKTFEFESRDTRYRSGYSISTSVAADSPTYISTMYHKGRHFVAFFCYVVDRGINNVRISNQEILKEQ